MAFLFRGVAAVLVSQIEHCKVQVLSMHECVYLYGWHGIRVTTVNGCKIALSRT